MRRTRVHVVVAEQTQRRTQARQLVDQVGDALRGAGPHPAHVGAGARTIATLRRLSHVVSWIEARRLDELFMCPAGRAVINARA